MSGRTERRQSTTWKGRFESSTLGSKNGEKSTELQTQAFFFFLFQRGGIIQKATSNKNGGESFPGRRIVS